MKRLRDERIKQGLSLRRLAELSGVGFVTIARLESGQLDPRLSTVVALCSALGVSLSDMVPITSSKQRGRNHGGQSRAAKG